MRGLSGELRTLLYALFGEAAQLTHALPGIARSGVLEATQALDLLVGTGAHCRRPPVHPRRGRKACIRVYEEPLSEDRRRIGFPSADLRLPTF